MRGNDIVAESLAEFTPQIKMAEVVGTTATREDAVVDTVAVVNSGEETVSKEGSPALPLAIDDSHDAETPSTDHAGDSGDDKNTDENV